MLGARIMIVEDERIVALHLRRQLAKLGYEVVGMATEGTRALERIEATRPDIVLMDINIEGDMDGIETASRIPPELQIPVLYLTAYSEEATLDRARESQPYGYLLKPFSEQELHASIQMVLERRRADVIARANEQRLEEAVRERTAALSEANVRLQEAMELRLKAEQDLAQAQKMDAIGQLTGGIAHDFNNALTVVRGNIEIVQRSGEIKTAQLMRALKAADRGAERASTLTGQLLAFARKQPLLPVLIDPSILVTGMEYIVTQTLGEMISIRIIHHEGVFPVLADSNQLETALLNLVINSRDAMPRGGLLTIETGGVILTNDGAKELGMDPGEYSVITVSDTGTGIPPELMQKIYEPFFTTKDIGKGTGLGLSQVYGFITQSGGHVRAESEVGSGTTIRLYLPCAKAVPRQTQLAPNQDPRIARAQAGTILVVEDDEDVRLLSVDMLEELGYRVLEARDASEALKLLEKEPRISMLFTDIGLPGMNGRELADAVVRRRPGIPVLFTSGYERDTIVHQGRLDPGVDLLTKPFSYSDLNAKILEVLGRRETPPGGSLMPPGA